MKILLLDIESAPNLVHVWGLWQQNVGLPQIIDSGYVMCWAAKWLGKKEIMFSSIHQESPEDMLSKIHYLLNEADAVIHYNGTKFDIPTLNKEFVLYGMPPPAPYHQIDLLKTARQQFRFPSNKLDYIAQALGLGKKKEHIGHELWIRCMNNDKKAWKEMEAYNKQDVVLLEKVYERIKPWIKSHINYSLYTDDSLVCPQCGSKHYVRQGYRTTSGGKYPRYQCTSCFTWFKGTKSEAPKAGNKYSLC